MAEAQHEQLRQDRRQLLKLGCADVDVEAGEVVVYLKRLLSKAGQGSLKLAHLFTDGGVPLCQADLRLALSEDEARRVEQHAAHALQQHCAGRPGAAGPQDPRHEPLLQLCQALHAHLAQLQQLQQAEGVQDGTIRAAEEGAARRLLEVSSALRALLAAHLPPHAATPLLVVACLSSGKLVQALLHLLAHQGMADLGRQAELMSQVLGLVSILAATPDLRQLLLQPSRISNEHLSLAQVLLLGAHQARALLAAPEAPGDGGAAARRMAALVVRVHQQVQGALAAQAEAGRQACGACGAEGDADMDEAPGSPAVQQPPLGQHHAHSRQQQQQSSLDAPGGVLQSPVCAALRSAMKRPASTELDELGRSLGVAARMSPSNGGRATPDWQQGSPLAAVAAARQQHALAACEHAAATAAAAAQQQTPPPQQPRPGHPLTNVVLESARRLSQTLHVSPPVSIRAASSGAASPTAPLALSRLHGGIGAGVGTGACAGGTATPPGRPCTPSDRPSSPSAARLLCEEAPLEFVDSPSRPGTGLLGLFSLPIPTGPPGPGAPHPAGRPAGPAGLRPVAISSPGAPRGMEEEETPSPSSGAAAPWGTPTTGQQQSSPDGSTWGSPGSWGPGEDGPHGGRHGSVGAAAPALAAGSGSGGAPEGEDAAAHPLPSCVLPLPISSLSSRLAAMQAGGLVIGPSPNRGAGALPSNGSPLRRSSAAGLPAWPGVGAGVGVGEQQQQQTGADGTQQEEADCGMESEDPSAQQHAQHAQHAQQQPMVQVSVYGQDGAVALLDPGFLRPDSPMSMEVPAAAAAAAAAWAAAAPPARAAAEAAAGPSGVPAVAEAGGRSGVEAAAASVEPTALLTGGDLGLARIRMQ
ncbi:hypothetical protein MNEG_7845, partial [Monoraphidium neglectum]